jgi:hypothetical protein
MLLYLYYFVFGGIVPINEMLSDGRWGGRSISFFIWNGSIRLHN